jgi:hypothetical protein
MRSDEPDFDVELKNRDQLKEEVIKLRKAIRKHRNSSGSDYIEMWNLLPDSPNDRDIVEVESEIYRINDYNKG